MLCASDKHFHHKLQYFDVALGFLQIRTPSIESVSAQKKPMKTRMLEQDCPDFFRELDCVLRVIQDWQPLAVLMGSNPYESLQHFIPLKYDPTSRCVQTGNDRTPDRVCMQNCTRVDAARCTNVSVDGRPPPRMTLRVPSISKK